jgi:hypothetical protein
VPTERLPAAVHGRAARRPCPTRGPASASEWPCAGEFAVAFARLRQLPSPASWPTSGVPANTTTCTTRRSAPTVRCRKSPDGRSVRDDCARRSTPHSRSQHPDHLANQRTVTSRSPTRGDCTIRVKLRLWPLIEEQLRQRGGRVRREAAIGAGQAAPETPPDHAQHVAYASPDSGFLTRGPALGETDGHGPDASSGHGTPGASRPESESARFVEWRHSPVSPHLVAFES